jgi:diguanylate cyclase (GGDEF)-like protein
MQVNTEIKRAVRLFIFLWTALISMAAMWNMRLLDEQVLHAAKIQAEAFINKDLAVRSWASSHGGVYVRPTGQTPPNPYLEVPNRDVVTTGGMALTLMNPAYVSRELHSRFAEKFNVRGHITSLIVTNPVNAPDDWERAGLERFATGDLSNYASVVRQNGKPFLRLMKPMLMEQSCLQCHAWTGIPVGGVRGGINAMVPLEALWRGMAETERYLTLSHLAIWLIGVAGIVWFGRRVRHYSIERLQSEVERQVLYRQATHDALTGLYNRRYLDEVLARELLRARRTASPLSVAFLDIDHFKRFNDEYGHEAGDEVLRALGGVLRGFLRKSDIACRYGGEELFVIMPDSNAKEVLPRLDALRQLVRATKVEDRRGRDLPEVTVSIGVVSSRVGDCGIEDLLARADQALYQAKAEGRNRIVLREVE